MLHLEFLKTIFAMFPDPEKWGVLELQCVRICVCVCVCVCVRGW